MARCCRWCRFGAHRGCRPWRRGTGAPGGCGGGGYPRPRQGARGRYVEFCKNTFPNELDLRGMKIALDCAHGAAYTVAPKVFHELGAELVLVGAEPNGMNINDKVGATSPPGLSTSSKMPFTRELESALSICAWIPS